MCRWLECLAIGERCNTMSLRCWSKGGTTICIAPLTVDRHPSSPSELKQISLLAWLTWAFAFWQKTLCVFAPLGLTRAGGSNVGFSVLALLLLSFCDSVVVTIILHVKWSHLRYGWWLETVAWHLVGFHLCLWWRVAIARWRLGAWFSHGGCCLSQILISRDAYSRVVPLSLKNWIFAQVHRNQFGLWNIDNRNIPLEVGRIEKRPGLLDAWCRIVFRCRWSNVTSTQWVLLYSFVAFETRRI